MTPTIHERTIAALQGAGLDLRRIREEPTPAGAPPAFFWGLAFVAPDLDATVAGLGDRVSEIRPAIQPGRRIATLRRSAGLAVPVALITPSAHSTGS